MTRSSIRLHEEFSSVPISTIEHIVAEAYAGFEGSRIREFIPLLVERETRDRLRAERPGPGSWGEPEVTRQRFDTRCAGD